MPGKHLIDTLIFIFCATSAQKKTFSFLSVPSAFAWGYAPFPKCLDPPLERKKEAARQGGREGGQAGREGGQAGRGRWRAGRQGEREGRQGESEGRQAGRQGEMEGMQIRWC